MQLADPADNKLIEAIDGWRTEKNYPVEWTQLVGLHLQLAELKLAHGEQADALEGATELVLLHKQLMALLDKKAAAGPLGAALLPIGRGALSQAVVAWRDGAQKKPVLADDVAAALKDWGAFPTGRAQRRPRRRAASPSLG